ncbi:YdcF family protein [bacterium]|nr:MAG: YdcF family protein [bacterium]
MNKRRLLLLTLVASPLIYLVAVALLLVDYGSKDRAQKADAIIIFGARVNSQGKASPILRARTRQAYELWKKGLAPRVVCTGGVGTYLPAEAIVQKELLEGWGVPARAISVDDRSTSTHENAINAAALLPTKAKVIAVSECFHLWRCERECNQLGLTVYISAEEPGWDQLRTRQQIYYALREAILVTRDLLTRH